jgi:hypothetical protein
VSNPKPPQEPQAEATLIEHEFRECREDAGCPACTQVVDVLNGLEVQCGQPATA